MVHTSDCNFIQHDNLTETIMFRSLYSKNSVLCPKYHTTGIFFNLSKLQIICLFGHALIMLSKCMFTDVLIQTIRWTELFVNVQIFNLREGESAKHERSYSFCMPLRLNLTGFSFYYVIKAVCRSAQRAMDSRLIGTNHGQGILTTCPIHKNTCAF